MLIRDFTLPTPLFQADSAWRQNVENVALKPDQEKYILEMYEMLVERQKNFCYLNDDDYTIPVYALDPTVEPDAEPLELRNYWNNSWQTSTLRDQQIETNGKYFVKGVPNPKGMVRPSGPQTTDADGHLVLVDPENDLAFDFWHASTKLNGSDSAGGGFEGRKILMTGAVEKFSLVGPGAQKPLSTCMFSGSARASGIPLLAGLLLPEDFTEQDEIAHALVFSLPRLRHIYPVDSSTPYDYVYPATKTETHDFNSSRWALASGERIRLKDQIIDQNGNPIVEDEFSPATKKLLKALRKYGAYLVDGGASFAFYAEDIRTAKLNLELPELNELCGRPANAPIPDGVFPWQLVTETINEEFPKVAFGFNDGTEIVSNFDFIENASVPDGFQSSCTVEEINSQVS